MIQACAQKIGAPIRIWKWCNDRSCWQRVTLAGKFSKGFAMCAKNRKPITLLLRQKHYCVLKPPDGVDVPSSWLRECKASDVDLAGAGVASRSSCASVDASHTRNQAPHQPSAAQNGCEGSDGGVTPSLHSLVGSPGVPPSQASGAYTPSLYTMVPGDLEIPSQTPHPERDCGSQPTDGLKADSMPPPKPPKPHDERLGRSKGPKRPKVVFCGFRRSMVCVGKIVTRCARARIRPKTWPTTIADPEFKKMRL